ncbi:MAG: hypothetical protein KGI25_03895 [Thaumarchaeota archaeon]|nr:hypothetical protein [Nitrososphaerota archaeon]
MNPNFTFQDQTRKAEETQHKYRCDICGVEIYSDQVTIIGASVPFDYLIGDTMKLCPLHLESLHQWVQRNRSQK